MQSRQQFWGSMPPCQQVSCIEHSQGNVQYGCTACFCCHFQLLRHTSLPVSHPSKHFVQLLSKVSQQPLRLRLMVLDQGSLPEHTKAPGLLQTSSLSLSCHQESSHSCTRQFWAHSPQNIQAQAPYKLARPWQL